jgi:aminopeptidase YwaD
MIERIEHDLRALVSYPDRRVGGPGNQAANAYFADRMEALGLAVRRRTFDCLDWAYGEASLTIAGERYSAFVGPYSPPCDLEARLVGAQSIDDLESPGITGAIVLVYGGLASGQVMPRNFTFYNPENHRRVIRALDEFAPAAVIAATSRDPEMVGSQYPYPLFEDGDLGVASAYLTDMDGERLRAHFGREARLIVDSTRIPSVAEQVVAVLPGTRTDRRVVLTAHIDSRQDSPGALDNASGVATLLAVADLLVSERRELTVEFVPFNGEDNYANPGEMLWISENEGAFGEIVVAINIDDLGMRGTTNHCSFYGCPRVIEERVRLSFGDHPDISEGPQWFQSDHAIFAMHDTPAMALTSSDIAGFMVHYAHSERDTLELAEPALIAAAARFLVDVIGRM